MKRCAFVILASLMLACAHCVSAYAQVRVPSSESKEKAPTTYDFSSLWTVRTNAFEWLVLIPNIGAEFDVSNSIYNRSTLGLTAKWNWSTSHKLAPSIVYDIFEVRPEYRYYSRCRYTHKKQWSEQKQDSVTVWTNHKDGALKYFGAYANYTQYAFLLGSTGYQGTAAGLGFSFGYVFPLYKFNKGALDLELGASVGIQATQYQAFTHNSDGSYYSEIPSKSRSWHVTPFPVLSEVRAALCWRHTPAGEKYIKEDPQVIHFHQDKKDVRAEIAMWTAEAFLQRHSNAEVAAFKSDDYLYRSQFVAYVNDAYEDAVLRYTKSDPDNERLSKAHKLNLKMTLDMSKWSAISKFDHQLLKDGRKIVKKLKEPKVKKEKPIKEPKVKKAKSRKDTQTQIEKNPRQKASKQKSK